MDYFDLKIMYATLREIEKICMSETDVFPLFHRSCAYYQLQHRETFSSPRRDNIMYNMETLPVDVVHFSFINAD